MFLLNGKPSHLEYDKNLLKYTFLLAERINKKERENLKTKPFPAAWPNFTFESCPCACVMAHYVFAVLCFYLLSQWGSILRARSLALRNPGQTNAGLYRQRRMEGGPFNSLLFMLLSESGHIKAAQNCLVPTRLPSNSPAQKTGGHSEHRCSFELQSLLGSNHFTPPVSLLSVVFGCIVA